MGGTHTLQVCQRGGWVPFQAAASVLRNCQGFSLQWGTLQGDGTTQKMSTSTSGIPRSEDILCVCVHVCACVYVCVVCECEYFCI